MNDIILSIVICTYNRAELAATALLSVLDAIEKYDQVEAVVVDNNSTDTTAHTIKNLIADKPNARYVFEPAQGLSHARNRGAATAVGTYVGYIDDECIVDDKWLDAALAVIENQQPAVFGGPYGPWYQGQKPAWFKDKYGSSNKRKSVAGALGPTEFISGGNFFVERKRIKEMGGFNPELGMSGNKISYGEETDFQIRLRKKDPAALVYFDPGVFLRHLVRPEKLDLWHIARLRFANGRVSAQIFARDKVVTLRSRGAAIGRCASFSGLIGLSALKGLVWRDRQTYPTFRNYFFEVIGIQIARFGSAWETAVGAGGHRES